MLDEQHRHVAAQAADALAQLAHVVAAEPAGRLVEQDQPRARRRAPAPARRASAPGRAACPGSRPATSATPSASSASSAAARSARSSRSERGSPSSAEARPARRRRSAPAMTFSSAVSPANSPTPCSVRAMPRPASWCGRTRAQRAPAPRDVAVVGAHEAADDVEERRLAGAVGPDDADDLAGRDRQRDLLEGRQPAEADRDRVDAQPISLLALVGGHGIPFVPRGRDLHAQRHGATVWVARRSLIVARAQTSRAPRCGRATTSAAASAGPARRAGRRAPRR